MRIVKLNLVLALDDQAASDFSKIFESGDEGDVGGVIVGYLNSHDPMSGDRPISVIDWACADVNIYADNLNTRT